MAISTMPWLAATYFDNTLLSYLTFFGIIILGFLASRVMVFINNRVIRKITKKTAFEFDDIVLTLAEKPFSVYIVLVSVWIGWNFLSFPNYPNIGLYFGHAFYLVIALNTAWLVSRVVKSLIDNYLTPLAAMTETDLDDTLIPILKKLVGVSVYAMAFIVIMNHFGQEIGPMIAGLGIGGLAFALAAKDILSNVFGSITVLMDKPFKIGERIRINGIDGYVQEISLRTTKIRTMDNTMVYVPNSKFTDSSVENVSQEPTRKIVMNLGLVYDTSNMKMKKAVDTIRKIIDSTHGVLKNPTVYFTEFGDFALNILVIYNIKDKKNISSIRHSINMAIKDKIFWMKCINQWFYI